MVPNSGPTRVPITNGICRMETLSSIAPGALSLSFQLNGENYIVGFVNI